MIGDAAQWILAPSSLRWHRRRAPDEERRGWLGSCLELPPGVETSCGKIISAPESSRARPGNREDRRGSCCTDCARIIRKELEANRGT